jgi:hypothetical protein
MKSGKEERKGRRMMEGMEGRICKKEPFLKIGEVEIGRKVENDGGRIFNEVESDGSYGGKAVAKDSESG